MVYTKKIQRFKGLNIMSSQSYRLANVWLELGSSLFKYEHSNKDYDSTLKPLSVYDTFYIMHNNEVFILNGETICPWAIKGLLKVPLCEVADTRFIYYIRDDIMTWTHLPVTIIMLRENL